LMLLMALIQSPGKTGIDCISMNMVDDGCTTSVRWRGILMNSTRLWGLI
jgi:hypothetical protein